MGSTLFSYLTVKDGIISWSEKMKNKTLRNDLIVIVILFLIIEGLFFFKSRKQGQLIEITKDNQIYGYYSLNEDQIIKIDQENTIQIKNQKVKMIQATCPDHLCIKQGTIDKKGSTIVCLPRVFDSYVTSIRI